MIALALAQVASLLTESEAKNLPTALGVRVWERAIPQLEASGRSSFVLGLDL